MTPATPAPDLASDVAWDGRRADARRNHDRVLAAAVEVFAEKGADATIPEIAERAGVGRATVYRSYATKAELVRAIAHDQLEWLDDRIGASADHPDAVVALEELLGDISERLARDRLFSQVLGQAGQWRQDKDHAGQLDVLIRRGRDEGRLRADVTAQDLQVLMGGCSRILLELDIRDPAQWRRYAMLVLQALRA